MFADPQMINSVEDQLSCITEVGQNSEFYLKKEAKICSRISNQTLIKLEQYFLNKIKCYKLDFQDELNSIQKELEDSKMAHLNCLRKLKQSKDKILELETKNEFYKKRLQKYESQLK